MEKNFATEEVLGWLKETAEKGADFIETQAPLLANEIVAWHFWASVTMAVMFAVIVSLLVLVLRHCIAIIKTRKESTPEFAGAFIFCSIGSVAVIVLGIASLVNVYEAVRASVAPRVVIIQHLSNYGRR